MQRSPSYTTSAPQQPVQLLDLPYILELGTLDPERARRCYRCTNH